MQTVVPVVCLVRAWFGPVLELLASIPETQTKPFCYSHKLCFSSSREEGIKCNSLKQLTGALKYSSDEYYYFDTFENQVDV